MRARAAAHNWPACRRARARLVGGALISMINSAFVFLLLLLLSFLPFLFFPLLAAHVAPVPGGGGGGDVRDKQIKEPHLYFALPWFG